MVLSSLAHHLIPALNALVGFLLQGHTMIEVILFRTITLEESQLMEDAGEKREEEKTSYDG